MRVWAKLWIAISVVCIGLTLYEIPNARRMIRFSRAMWKNRHTAAGKLNVPAIVTDRLIADDPEAGDMLRYCLTYHTYAYENPNLEELAALVEKWPENEFFLSQLAEGLTEEILVHAQAALALIDRLMTLNPQNAHNRYLRGWICLTDPNHPHREQDALEEFEIGHRLPQFYLPYGKYKARLDRLCDKANLIWFWKRPQIEPFYKDLARQLLLTDRMNRRFDEKMFHDLSGSVVKIGDCIVENAYDSETLRIGATLLGPGEGIRLTELDLPETEARQSRLRAARGSALLDKYRELSNLNDNTFYYVTWIVMIPFILFITMVPLLSIVIEFTQARFNWPKPKIRKYIKPYMVIDVVLLLVLVLLAVLELLKKRPEGELPLFLFYMAGWFSSWGAIGLLDITPVSFSHLRRPRLWVAVLCGSLWFKGVVFWMAGSLNITIPDNLTDWLRYVGPLLFWSVLCVLIWTEGVYRPIASTAKRWNRAALIAYWIVLLMIFHIFGLASAPIERTVADPMARYRPLPGATQETYNRVILGQGEAAALFTSGPHAGMPRRIFCAAPKDLKAFIAQRREAGRSMPEDYLLYLLRNCNRDLRNILLEELTDPNVYEVLEIRAEWGDRSVKEQFEQIYQKRLAAFRKTDPETSAYDRSSIGTLLDLAGTLAHISDDPEAQERFTYLMEEVVDRTRGLGTRPALGDPRYTNWIMQPFWKALGELPADRAGTLIKSYLRQTRFVDLSADRGRAIIHLADLLADGDRELAEEVIGALAVLPSAPAYHNEPTRESAQQRIRRLTRHRNRNTPHCLEAIFAHLTTESIPVLLRHLDSDNDQLRAFIVWRLTSLGYEWPRDRLQELTKDPSGEVRLNALFALDPDELRNALDDENAVVGIIAQTLRQARPS